MFEYLGRSAEIVLPNDFGFGAEPGELALGVVPGFELEVSDGFILGDAAGEVVEGLLVAEGGEGFGGRRVKSQQMTGFFDEAGFPNTDGASIQSAI